jgi:hypothetical protein
MVSSFRNCILLFSDFSHHNDRCTHIDLGSWKLEYDLVVAHALICAVRGNTKALRDAAIGVDRRCRQAAAFLSDIPVTVEQTMETQDKETKETEADKSKSADGDKKKDSKRRQFEIMDFLFRGHGLLEDTPAVYWDLVELKPPHRVDSKSGYSVKVSMVGGYNLLCARCSSFSPLDNSAAAAALNDAMGSARAWAKIGKWIEMNEPGICIESDLCHAKRDVTALL